MQMILFEEAIWLESEKGGDWRGGEGGGEIRAKWFFSIFYEILTTGRTSVEYHIRPLYIE